eukprot:311600-Amorphochlora_amoeboformis.AAC.1
MSYRVTLPKCPLDAEVATRGGSKAWGFGGQFGHGNSSDIGSEVVLKKTTLSNTLLSFAQGHLWQHLDKAE